MAETTIEWTATRLPDGTVLPGYTFNPWEGCTAVSPACDNCYAEVRNNRFHKGVNWGAHAPRRGRGAAYWKKPLAWNREAERTGIRRKVFCASLADVFDNHKSIDPQWREDLWALIRFYTPHLDWLLLTKRPQNIAKYLPDNWGAGAKNVWLGTTVENQEEADRRIPHLLSVPAKVRFLSMEPLLGPVNLEHIGNALFDRKAAIQKAMHGPAALNWHQADAVISHPKIGWVITGGESGKNARPSHPDWFRSIRDQCAAADVPFFFKQWGEFGIIKHPTIGPLHPNVMLGEHHKIACGRGPKTPPDIIAKVGKKTAGRLLDGIEHNGMPE